MSKKKTKTLLHGQTIYYADMNMMYVNCELSNNKKLNYKKTSFTYVRIYMLVSAQ